MLLTEKIIANRITFANQKLFAYLDEENREVRTLTYEEFATQAIGLAGKLQTRVKQGDKAILIYAPGLDFIISFYACLFAGIVAVPVAEIIEGNEQDTVEQVSRIARDLGECVLLTTGLCHSLLIQSHQLLAQAGIAEIIDTSLHTPAGIDTNYLPRVLMERDLVCLLYTSGSTSEPKGVMIRHKDFLYNAQTLADAWEFSHESIAVSWMPHYHSFGLVFNLLVPVYAAGTAILLSPASFIRSPHLWLTAISHYRATHSAAPTFGYLHAATRATENQVHGIDLSSWHMGLIAAEPVKSFVYDTFFKRFARYGLESEFLKPLYGLSEAGPVTTVARHETPFFKPEVAGVQTLSTASVGKPLPGTTILCINPESSAVCQESEVGEVWIAGPSVTEGYWGKEELNRQVFGLTIEGVAGKFFRTGDLGYIWHEELYITGRLKEVLIIHGKNYYPADLEWAMQQADPQLAHEKSAIFSMDSPQGEQVVVVQEIPPHLRAEAIEPLYRSMLQAAFRFHKIQLGTVVFVATGSIPRTKSGKIQRSRCKTLFERNELPVIAVRQSANRDAAVETTVVQSTTGDSVRDQLITLIATILSLTEVDENLQLDALNLDSIQVAELAAAIEATFALSFPAILFFKYKSVDQIYTYIQSRL